MMYLAGQLGSWGRLAVWLASLLAQGALEHSTIFRVVDSSGGPLAVKTGTKLGCHL